MEKDENVKTSIATKLRALRAERGLTQSEVAGVLGISQQTYSKYENQDANIDSAAIVKICEIFEVSSDYLLGLQDRQLVDSTNNPDEEIEIIVNKVLSKINDGKSSGD